MSCQKERSFSLSEKKPHLSNVQQHRERFYDINKAMLPYKIHFFFCMGALGAVTPFMTVYGNSVLQLSATAIGTLLTVQQFVFVFTTPLISLIVDYFNKMKATIIALIILQIIFYLMFFHIHLITNVYDVTEDEKSIMGQIPDYHDLYHENLSSGLNESETLNDSLKSCFCKSRTKHQDGSMNDNKTDIKEYRAISFETHYNKTVNNSSDFTPDAIEMPKYLNESSLERDVQYNNEFRTVKFWLFAALLILSGACTNAVITISDTACYQVIKKTGADFGRQRIWAGIGWATISPIAGHVLDYTGSYLSACFIMAVYSTISIFNIIKLDLLKPDLASGTFNDLRKIFRSGEFIAFVISVFNNGLLVSLVWFYLMLYLQEIGGNQLVIGMSQLVQALVGELPLMFFAGIVIKKIGHFNCLSLSFLGYLIRYYAYSYLYDPWLAVIFDATHGLTYGIFITALTSYASSCALPGTETTTQAILGGTYYGLGAGIGSIIAGVGFDHLGGHRSFFWAFVGSVFAMILNIAFTFTLNKRKKTFDVEKASDPKSLIQHHSSLKQPQK